jgi:hypothetical protein
LHIESDGPVTRSERKNKMQIELIKPRSGNRNDLRKLASQLEEIAGELYPCDANLERHLHLMNRAKHLRKIASTYSK